DRSGGRMAATAEKGGAQRERRNPQMTTRETHGNDSPVETRIEKLEGANTGLVPRALDHSIHHETCRTRRLHLARCEPPPGTEFAGRTRSAGDVQRRRERVVRGKPRRNRETTRTAGERGRPRRGAR